MSKHKGKEAELIDIGKKLGKSQSKDALVKLLLVRGLKRKNNQLFLQWKSSSLHETCATHPVTGMVVFF